MRIESLKKGFTRKVLVKVSTIAALVTLAYLLAALYFTNHFFMKTIVNGVDISLKAYADVDKIMEAHVKDFVLTVMESDGKTEEIKGQDIGLKYKIENSIPKIYKMQNSLSWVTCIWKSQYYVTDTLFTYSNKALENRINRLHCLNRKITESENVSFRYSNGAFEAVKEVYGNKIRIDKLTQEIINGILRGETGLDLKGRECYYNPVYKAESKKARKTLDLLNKIISANITYLFGRDQAVLDGGTIHQWLKIDENLDVDIEKEAVAKYVKSLAKKFDTVGIARQFKTSLGKTLEVKGGLYGWKIDQPSEVESLMEAVRQGAVIKKEPIYKQKALYRGEDEIGNTYVEINITRQHLWFYKDGKLIAHGPVVTGNPARGNPTVVGAYMLNYKLEGATLSGPGYEVKVKYWMPFYGNIGLHDASWRHAFGGQIYKSRGTHGCVNAPLYLAQKIYEYIGDGIPIISYEE